MHRTFIFLTVCAALLLGTSMSGAVAAAPPTQTTNYCAEGQEPEFVLGFAFLYSQLGAEIMGAPTECEHYDPAGNAIQTTTTGMAVWVKAQNMPTFARGDEHWAWNGTRIVTWTGDSATPPADDTPAPPSDDTPSAPGNVNLQLVADGFWSPVSVAHAPDGSNHHFVVDQIGVIRIVDSNGALLPDPFLDVRDRMVELNPAYDERGLMGLAFHPDYDNNGKFYVYYSAPRRSSAPADWDHTARISEFTVSDDINRANPDSERIIIQIDKPQGNHNGGTIGFGPDGYFYISMGDGGAANDDALGHVEDWYAPNAGGNAQNIEANLLGKILRIDVNSGNPYGIPRDNPFVNERTIQPEIYAYGLRNPYRMSWDMGGTRHLFVGDAGQDIYEEVSIVERGGNYGWNVREGRHCFSTTTPESPPASCPWTGSRGEQLIGPIIEYAHDDGGLVVVGGYVYRGSAIPSLEGKYIFGDWSSSFEAPLGTLYVATRPASGHVWAWEELRIANMANGEIGDYIMGFGQDSGGEVYVLTTDAAGPGADQSGKLYKIVPAP